MSLSQTAQDAPGAAAPEPDGSPGTVAVADLHCAIADLRADVNRMLTELQRKWWVIP